MIHTIAIASLSVGVAFAQGPAGPGGQGGPPPGAAGPVGRVLHGWLDVLPPPPAAQQIDLTSAQQTSIHSLMSEQQSSSRTSADELRALGSEAHKLALSTSYTESDAIDIATKEAADAESLVLAAQKTKGEIVSSVLTSAQRTELASLDANAPAGHGSPSVDRQVQMLTHLLDLTSSQQNSVTTLLTDASSSQAAAVRAIRAELTTYEAAHPDGAYSESAVESAYKSAKTSVVDFIAVDIKTQNAIWSLLDDTQKTKFESVSPRGPGGPGGPPQGGGGERPHDDNSAGPGGDSGPPPEGPPPADIPPSDQ